MREAAAVWLEASEATLAFVGDPRIREQWTAPSSLPLMTVGELSGHLIHSGILLVEAAFAFASVSDAEPVTAAQMLSWVPSDPVDPVHDQVRAVAGSHAAPGLDGLLEEGRTSLRAMEPLIASTSPEKPLAFPPAPLITISLEELLRSRVVELVVHVDDLARSIGEPTIPLDEEAVALACHVATDIDIARHGPAPVLRALCRPERNPVDVLRAF